MGGGHYRSLERTLYCLVAFVDNTDAVGIVFAAPLPARTEYARDDGAVDFMAHQIIVRGGKTQHGIEDDAHFHVLGSERVGAPDGAQRCDFMRWQSLAVGNIKALAIGLVVWRHAAMGKCRCTHAGILHVKIKSIRAAGRIRKNFPCIR